MYMVHETDEPAADLVITYNIEDLDGSPVYFRMNKNFVYKE
jgi:hypothetical protein